MKRSKWLFLMAPVFLSVVASTSAAGDEIDAKCKGILTKYSDFFKGLKSCSVDVKFEGEGDSGPLAFSGKVLMEKPNKFSLRVQEGTMKSLNAYIVSDGKTLVHKGLSGEADKEDAKDVETMGRTFLDPDWHMGNIATGILFPNVLAANPYDSLMEGVTKVTHAGEETIDGVKTDHLKFVQPGFDWEMWISQDAKPQVVKLSTDFSKQGRKTVTETYKNWKYDEAIKADEFKLPAATEKKDDKPIK